ncbi:AAA family ATPase [Priestia sp. TGN 0903]|uniref:AAA family ATPase n=1 Tax=Priestia sp. TGN 0903 TaxID=3420730 RepID=UPI003D78009C
MRIDRLEIKNFRNYLGRHVFKLNKNITILYGDNGNGKSSFFDALEWGLTGNISRFNGSKTPKEALANKKIPLGEDCYVEIYFANLCIKRIFYCNEEGFGNIEFSLNTVEETGGLRKITSGEDNVDRALREKFQEQGVNFKDLKYKVGEIIKKAYILSQDQVADFVTRDKPNDRYNALASIMGFEKIVKIRKNISNSKKIIDEKIGTLTEKEEKLKDHIKTQQQKRKFIDNNILTLYQKQYENENFPLEEKELQRQYDDLQRNIYNNEEEIRFLKGVKNEEISNLADLSIRMEEKRKQILICQDELNKFLIKDNDVSEKIKQLKVKIKNILDNENLKKELENLEKEIKELEDGLHNLKLDIFPYTFDNLKNNIQKIEQKQKLISYAKKYKSEYDKAKQIIDGFENTLSKENLLLSTKQDALSFYLKEQQKLSESILINDENSSLNELINGMEQILSYVTKQTQKEVCPVCSSKVDNDLDIILKTNINELIDKLDQHKEQVTYQLNLKKQNSKAITKEKDLIAKQENVIEELKFNFNVALDTLRRIEGNALFGEFFGLSYTEIGDIYKRNNTESDKLNSALKICVQIEELKEKMNLTISSQESITEGSLKTLQVKYEELQGEVKIYSEEIDYNKSLLTELNEEMFKLSQIKSKLTSFLNGYDKNLNLDVKEVYEFLLKSQQDLKNNLHLIRKVEQIASDMLYNSEIDKELKILFMELKKVKTNKKDFAKKAIILFQLISKIDREYGKETADFLNDNDTVIQRYYRYLNPRPSEFNNLHFEIVNNESLSIKILNANSLGDKYSIDANMVLSSGQLNVLALAIFIATNQAQECSYFDFAAIDDPIQNMDDINRFSICDLLSNLNKQLIFSTHDQEFLSLFVKKNEHKNEFLTVYMLNADENSYKSIII